MICKGFRTELTRLCVSLMIAIFMSQRSENGREKRKERKSEPEA